MKRMRRWAGFAAATAAVAVVACSHVAPRRVSGGPVATKEGIRFTFYAPTAARVQLAGSWPGNNWARGDGSVGEADIGLMTDDDNDGLWEIVVALPPGRHQYLFWLDENRYELDPGNMEEVAAPLGPAETASLIVVYIRDGRYELR